MTDDSQVRVADDGETVVQRRGRESRFDATGARFGADGRPIMLPVWGDYPLKDLWTFIYERERIRCLRFDHGRPGPWTEDPVMRDRFLTNMFREDDPGTYVASEIVDRERPAAERLWNLALYRRFNREAVWRDAIGYIPWDENFATAMVDTLGRLRQRRADKKAVFTDAHQVYPLVQLARDDDNKDLIIRSMRAAWDDCQRCERLAPRLEASADIQAALKLVVKAKMPGISDFLGWQLTLDSRYGRWPIVTHDDDWAPTQQGSEVGLTIWRDWPNLGVVLYASGTASSNRNKKVSGWPHLKKMRKPEREEFMARLCDTQADEFASRGLDFHAVSRGRDLTLSSLEHAICEAQKYWSVGAGMPSSKRLYRP